NSPCFRRMYFLRLCPALSLEYFSDCIMKPFPALSIIIGAFDFGSIRLTREAISPNCVSLYGSSKPGKRSFGRFSRPLLEDTFAIIIRPPLQKGNQAPARQKTVSALHLCL